MAAKRRAPAKTEAAAPAKAKVVAADTRGVIYLDDGRRFKVEEDHGREVWTELGPVPGTAASEEELSEEELSEEEQILRALNPGKRTGRKEGGGE